MPFKRRAKKADTNGQQVAFRVAGSPGLAVFVAGSFNDWDPRRDRLRELSTEGVYALTLRLPPGRHEYRFVVRKQWYTDPLNPETVVNAYGSRNSVVTVN